MPPSHPHKSQEAPSRVLTIASPPTIAEFLHQRHLREARAGGRPHRPPRGSSQRTPSPRAPPS
uniref:Uncharacterized protein n=1 Tax=Arundo donax TaxID=35708 RepID=A0A0A8Y5I3_ARUDO